LTHLGKKMDYSLDRCFRLPFASVSVADNPCYAVVGQSEQFGSGIISWHCDEFSAHANAKQVRKLGGTASVRLIESTDEIPQDEILDLIFQ
jgi:hypothetical protein